MLSRSLGSPVTPWFLLACWARPQGGMVHVRGGGLSVQLGACTVGLADLVRSARRGGQAGGVLAPPGAWRGAARPGAGRSPGQARTGRSQRLQPGWRQAGRLPRSNLGWQMVAGLDARRGVERGSATARASRRAGSRVVLPGRQRCPVC